MEERVNCKLGDLFEFEYGKGLPKKQRNETGSYPVYGSNGIVGFHDEYLIEGPAIIIGRKGAAGEVAFEEKNLWPIDTTYFVKVPQYLDFIFSFFLLKSLVLSQLDKSTAIPGLNRNDAYNLNINLPPLSEQRAIVSKIEQLFSELDNGVSNLKLAHEQLKVYRQAVLKKAFEGELTKKWREENPEIEDSKYVLNKIKNQISTQNKTKKIQNFQYGEVPYELPFKWNWVSLSDVSISITDGDHQAPPKANSGVPFIVISNISSGKLDMSETMYVPEKYYENLAAKRKPQPRDILYSVTGSYGIPILISENYRFCFQRHIALIRPHMEISSKYVYYILKSPFVYKQATKVATGTAQLTVPLSGLRTIKVPLPPTAEQQAIVQEIETRLSVCNKIEQDIETNLEKAEALRQSILKKAFEGKLLNEKELAEVRGEEDWEPAEALLERIKAEKSGNGKKVKQETGKVKSIIQDDKELVQQATLQAFEQIDK
ncbi:restriction endonuclease subunit S [Methanosarcina sp. UBA5]|uniref:restriction endonuclease subunit S n=1 Tax=Methanosarcina sp. UBA5 TaxID=1915593 RepID=UPI0025CD7FF3|nr:restriction endonuclease subunit S [Methanosarcina sp. UBA5]